MKFMFFTFSFVLTFVMSNNAFAENRTYDCGLITGLQKAAVVNDVAPSAYGDGRLMASRWKLRAERLVQFSEELKNSAALVDDRDLSIALTNASESLTYFEGGYGDVKYWVEKNKQLGQLETSTLKTLTSLQKRVCEG